MPAVDLYTPAIAGVLSAAAQYFLNNGPISINSYAMVAAIGAASLVAAEYIVDNYGLITSSNMMVREVYKDAIAGAIVFALDYFQLVSLPSNLYYVLPVSGYLASVVKRKLL